MRYFQPPPINSNNFSCSTEDVDSCFQTKQVQNSGFVTQYNSHCVHSNTDKTGFKPNIDHEPDQTN